MAGPVLLVHDDIAEIAAVRRLLVRDGYEVMVVSSAADALIAFGHYLPSLIILAPSVEGARGSVILEELRQHPDAKLARVLLLGESVPGFGFQVAPMPLDGGPFLQQVGELIRGSETQADQWTVVDIARADPVEPARHLTKDEWRATAPLEVGSPAGGSDIFDSDWQVAAMTPEERDNHERTVVAERNADAAASYAFEQTHQEIEAEAIASINRTIPAAVTPASEEFTEPGVPTVEELIHDTLSSPVEEDPVLAEIQASLAEGRKRREEERRKQAESDRQMREAGIAGDEDADVERAKLAKARQEAERAAAKERERAEKLRARASRLAQEEDSLFEPTPPPGPKLDATGELEKLEAEMAARSDSAAQRIEESIAQPSPWDVFEKKSENEPVEAAAEPSNWDVFEKPAEERAITGAERTHFTELDDEVSATPAMLEAAGVEAPSAAQREIAALLDEEVSAQADSVETTANEFAPLDDIGADAPVVAKSSETDFSDVGGVSDAASTAARDDAEEARTEAEAAAQREAEEAAHVEAEAAAQREADEAARIEAEAAAQREVEEAARIEAEAAAQREAEETARVEAEAAAQREAEEAARVEAEAAAQREAEEAARVEAEAAAQREAEMVARVEAESAAQREAEEAARIEAEAAAQREAEEAARVEAEAAAQREAEEVARVEAEAAAQREAEEVARVEAEAAAQREAEEAARVEAEDAAQREAEEAARVEAEAAAQREADEAARVEAEAAAQAEIARVEAEVAAQAELTRIEAEAAARAELARIEAEAAAQTEIEQAARAEAARVEAEAAAQREIEEAARVEAEAAAQREIDEVARRELERIEAEAAQQAELEAAAVQAAKDEVVARAEIERLSREASEKAQALAAAAEREAEERARREELEKAASEAEARADAEAQLRVDAETRAHTQLQKLAAEREEARLRSVRLAEEAAEREVAANEAQSRASEFEAQAHAAREEIVRAETRAQAERERREQLTLEIERLRHLAQEAQERAKAAEDEAKQQRLAHEEAIRAAEQQHLSAEQVARAEAAEEARTALESKLAALQLQLTQQREELEAEKRSAVERTRQELEAQRREIEEQLKLAAEEAERARAEAKHAASRTLIPLERPGKAPLPVMGAGAVSVTQLAALVSKLAMSKSEARLELQADDALRTLWFRRGGIVGAASNVPHDSLLDRARRDGLIDARQENELRLVRTAGSTEILRVLKLRGFVRDTEAVPLVQRHHEQVALEAMSEQQSTYRLSLEPILDEVVAAELPRPPMHIVAEALRRALSSEEFLRNSGGMTATVALTDGELDGKALGFTDRERRMLSLIDGQVTIEELLLGSGIKQEQGLKALAVAHALQMIDVTKPVEEPTAAPADRDIERLEAKYEELADADYFSLLGLARSAGTDEVVRAFENLTREFDPIKFVGHPDAGLQHRARLVTDALSEAARALQDDRLRTEYARNLLD